MTDYIKEFGDNQKGKNLPIDFGKPEDPSIPLDIPIRHLPHSNAVKQAKYFDPTNNIDNQKHNQNEEELITTEELKEVVIKTVLNFMNGPETEPTELLKEQKLEIEKRIKEYCDRQGMMSIYFSEEPQLNEAWVGAILDPTNKKSWMHLKQEKICTVPYAYRKPLMEYAKKVWNENKVI